MSTNLKRVLNSPENSLEPEEKHPLTLTPENIPFFASTPTSATTSSRLYSFVSFDNSMPKMPNLSANASDQEMAEKNDYIDLICTEIVSVNGEKLLTPSIDEIEALELLRQVFSVNKSNVFGVAIIKSKDRGVGFNFKLNNPIEIDVSRFQNFEFTIGQSTFQGRLFVPQGPPPQLGELVIVTIRRTGFRLSPTQIVTWLNTFGKVEGTPTYRKHPRDQAMREDSLEVLVKLKHHIPSMLPAYGRRMFVSYRGQPIQCGSCYGPGHIRRDCKYPRISWLSYVRLLTERITEYVAEDSLNETH